MTNGQIRWNLLSCRAEPCSEHLPALTRSSEILSIFNQSGGISGRSWRSITGSAARISSGSQQDSSGLFTSSSVLEPTILRLERDLQSAAAELAEVVGWLAYDAEAHDLARRMNQESLYFARLAGDKTIELLTLQNSSMHAASQGRPKEALQIARSVLEGDYRLSPRLKALFLTRKARALAQGGDDSALRLLPEIRSLYHEGVSDEDPAWAWWIDERELAWHEAMVQRDLGMPERAIAQFERSVIATPPTEIRSQYLHRAYLLQAQVDNATWDDAEQSIRQLLPLSTEVASTRTVVLLRKVISQLAAHPRELTSPCRDVES